MRRKHSANAKRTKGDPGLAQRAALRDALHLREGQLRGILESASEGMVTVDAAQTIVMANQAAADMFRCRIADLVGAPLERLVPERSRALHAQDVAAFGAAESAARRMGRRGGVTGLRADGEEFPLEAGISQVHVDGMRLYTAILRDLTESRRAAAALRTSQEMLAATFAASDLGMAQVDPATRRLLAVNRALCKLSGYAEHELLAMEVDQLNHPQDRLDPAKLAALLQGEEAYHEEKRLVRKDGSVVWVQISGSAVRGEDGQVLRVMSVIQDITGRREAEAVLRASESRHALLVRLNDRLRPLDDPRAIVREATALLGRFVGAARVGYAEDDGDGETCTVGPGYNEGVPPIEGRLRYRDLGAAMSEAVRRGRTVMVPDGAGADQIDDAAEARRAALRIGAAVNVPLLEGGRPQAVLFVHAAAARDWSPDEVALIEEVAQRLRADLERAGAEAALRAREARQAFLVRLNDRLRQLDDPQAIAFEAACLLGEFVGAARAGYADDDGHGEALVAGRGYVHGVPGIEGRHRYADYGPVLVEAIHAGRTLVRPDIAGESGLTPAQRAAYAAIRLGAAVHVPLLNDWQPHAVLYVHSATPRQWTADEVSLFEDVAQRLRADIERTRAQAEVRAARAKLEAALESMLDAVGITDEEGRFVDVNTAFATFHRFRDKSECPRTVAAWAEVLEVSGADGQRLAPEHWSVPRALRGESGSNVEYELRRKDTGERWCGSFSFAPVRDPEGVIVGAVLAGRDITGLKHMHAELRESHAELQRLMDAQDQVAEQERLRIARELHDELQQGLAAITMQAAAIRQRLRGQDTQADLGLASIGRIGEQVIAATRRIVQDLRPQILEDLGLGAALEALASQFTQSTGIACTVEAALPAAEPARVAPVAACLYRVAQEALNNAAKHSGAKAVRITVGGGGGEKVQLSIADDGVGLPEPRAPKASAFGLLGMRERVRGAGGRLEVRSRPGLGTTVEVEVPLPSAAREPGP